MRIGWMRRMRLVGWLRVRSRGGRGRSWIQGVRTLRGGRGFPDLVFNLLQRNSHLRSDV